MNLYESIEKSIRGHEYILWVPDNVQESDVRHAIRWVMRDNPDIFWFVHQYHFDKNKGTVSFMYRCSPERSAIIQESIEDVVENDFQINHVRTLPQLEQVAYVYKWLLTYCNYNVNSAYNQNIDSVFVRRNSVCTGYAKAAQYLFKLLGIESRLVFGRLNNDKEDGRHCWNIVCVEEIDYHLDVCLGDLTLEDVLMKAGATTVKRYGDYNYNCFCISTDEISKTRSIENVETQLSCDSLLPIDEIERLSRIEIKQREENIGCSLTHIGSSADVFLCTKDKNVVLKKFRESNVRKCEEEYGCMDCLRGCKHLLQLNDTYSDMRNNILAIEQSAPIVDLFCSYYYHPTLNDVLRMIKDITLGWLECQQHGIMYRDIHVCNIYKANDGRYKLGDFGSCTYELRGLRERVGNPWFMSPETYISGQFDERSAVYSITAVLYFVLNGLRPPFVDGYNEEEALQRKMNGEVLPEPALLRSFPKDIAEMIMTNLLIDGCAYYPSERMCSCKKLLHIIDDVLRSNIDYQRIELRFVQQNTETILANKTAPNVYIYIPRNIRHRFAYGEEVERMAKTAIPCCRTSVPVSNKTAPNVYIPHHYSACEEVEKMARTVIPSCMASAPVSNIVKTKIGFDYTPKPKEMSKEGAAIGSVTGSIFSSIGVILSGMCGLFCGKTNNTAKYDAVYSSIFAPAEVKRKSHMLVQVYLHLYEETEKVKALAQESQKDAERRDYISLQCKLKEGDKVDVLLNIHGETLLMSEKKSIVWQGAFTKCSFDYFVPNDIDVDELSCMAILIVNGIPKGEMRFVTKIVEMPRQLHQEIITHKYNKVFISYAHKDEKKVKSFHEGLKLAGIEHFFDRAYLKTGDIFPKVIQDYINSADLFVLFWSENASKSEYVKKERAQALERAFPQVKPQEKAKLSIFPMSIEPRTELPIDMKNYYHFGEL